MEKDELKIPLADLELKPGSFASFVLEGLDHVFYFHDVINDKSLFISQKVLDKVGYDIESVHDLEDGFRSLIHPDDIEEVAKMNADSRSLADGEFAQATYRVKLKDGGWAWFRSEEYVYKRTDAGEVAVIFGLTHEKTELKQREFQLKELADHNAFLVEISRLITVGQGDMKSTLEELAKRLAEHFNVVCSIFFVEERDDSIRPGAVYYHDQELVEILKDLFPKTTVKVGDGMVGKVVQDGAEYIVSETDEDIRNRTAAVNPKLEAVGLAYLPIKGLTKTVGAIGLVQLIEFEPFTAEQWEVIAQVVRNVSLFVEHSIITNERKQELDRLAIAEAEVRKVNEGREFLLILSRIVSDLERDRDKVLRESARMLSRHFEVVCDIHIIDEEGSLIPVAMYHKKKTVREKVGAQFKRGTLKVGHGLMGGVAESGTEHLVRVFPMRLRGSVGLDPEIIPESFIYLPLRGLDNKVVGVLGLTRITGQPHFAETELARMRSASNTISEFLAKRQLYDEKSLELRRRQEVEDELLEINRSNAFQLEVSKVLGDLSSDKLKTIYSLAKMISIHFDAVSDIHLIDEEDTLEPVAWYHPKRLVRKKVGDMFSLGRFKVGQGILGNVAKSGKEFILKELDEEFYEKVQKIDPDVRACSFIYLPLKGSERVVGTFGLSRLFGQDEFTEGELEQIRMVVSTISLFLDNRLLFEARDIELGLRTRAELHLMELDRFNQFLLGVSQQLSDLGAEMTNVLQSLSESVTQQFDVGCNIHLVDLEKKYFKPLAVSHKNKKLEKRIRKFFTEMKFQWDYGIVGEVVKKGEMVRIKKVSAKHRKRFDTKDDALVPGSLLYLPIKGRAGTVGILDVTRPKDAHPISEEEVDQLREVASNISLFITNHLEFEQRQEELERRKKAEQELIERNRQIELAEQELRQILDTMPILVSRIDKDYKYRFANKAYEMVVGQNPDEMVGKHLVEVAGSDFFNQIQAKLDLVMKGNITSYSSEGKIANGEYKFFDIVHAPDIDTNGKVIGVLSCIIDNTQKALAEKELESSEEQLQIIFDNVDAHISTFDKNGVIETVNRTSQGLTKEQVIGTPIEAFFSDERLKVELRENVAKLVSKGEAFEMENQFEGSNGTTNYYHNRYVGVFDDDKFTKGIIITRDVTAEREKEKAEMQAMIQGQESERKRVAADMHDGVGQILSAISIELSQLKARKLVRTHDLESLSDKVQHGIVEVRNVSHALKPDVLEHFGLVPAIEEVCNTLSSDFGPDISFNHIDVEKRFSEEVEINIYRIVQELLNNCIKHANANDVFVTLIRDNDSLVLTVEDDGQGISQTDHTGIGLNNVRLRVGLINGDIDIESTEGKGSLINIEVPI